MESALAPWLVAAILGPTPGAAAQTEGAACAVRLRAPAAAPGRGTAPRLAALLQSFPDPPVEIRPLLGSGAPQSPAARGVATLAAAAERAPGPSLQHPMSAWYILRFSGTGGRDAALAALGRRPEVEAVEPVRELVLCEAPGAGPGAARGWMEGETPWNVLAVRAPEALQLVRADSTLVVAVIDTGADLRHPDLVRRIWNNDDPPGNASTADDLIDQNGDGIVEDWERDDDDDNGYVDDQHGYDFTDAPGKDAVGDALDRDPDPSDDHGHGTHVAGIIAADGSLRGVAPFVRLMPVRAAYTTPFGGGVLETDDAAAAIVYAADNGARILNLSWGDSEESRLVREAIAYAVGRGCLVVAAAGNGSSGADFFPSGDPLVVGVAAVDRSGLPARFSNFGPGVEIAAPGEESPFPGAGITSLAPGGGRAVRRGTSMAAPHVAGVAAILMSRADHPDAARVRALLAAGARRPGPDDWTPQLGHGQVDALAALQSHDELILAVRGPARPYRDGRLLLVGTVLGGDLVRYRVEARFAPAGLVLPITPWRRGRVIADTLASAPLDGEPEGAWEYVLRAETSGGRWRETHGSFTLDRSPPHADTLFALAGWRGSEPRWLVTLRADEEVDLRVQDGAGRVLLGSDAGLARRLQIELPVQDGAGSTWSARLVNAAGIATDTSLAAPPRLDVWPGGTRLEALDQRRDFRPEAVCGPGPSGAPVVWGRGLVADTSTTLQAWGVQAGRLVLEHDSGRIGRPVSFRDTNGDGSPDLLYQLDSQVVWLVTRHAGSWPDSVAAILRAGSAFGLFQLDEDAPFEAILARADTLFLCDDAASGAPRRLQNLANPSRRGFDDWAADAAAGDLNGDGRIEIACGDAEGNLTVFERGDSGSYASAWSAPSGGVYADDFTALPEGGFLVGRQRTASIDGDGAPTAPFEFVAYAAQASRSYRSVAAWSFLAPENELRAASAAVRSPASGAEWLALVRGGDLYLLRGTGADRRPESHFGGAAGAAPAMADLDGDGALEIVLRAPAGALLFRVEEARRAPHHLAAESLGPGRLMLRWEPGSAPVSRLRRARDAIWETLADISGTTWIDTTLTPLASYEYEVQGVDAGEPAGVSNRISARSQPRPRLLGGEPLGEAGLRLRFSNPMRPEPLEARRWRVEPQAGGPLLDVLQVTLAAAGREACVVLATPLACGAVRVWADSLRDDQGGLLDPPASAVEIRRICSEPGFFLRELHLEGESIVLEFSRRPSDAALDPGAYTLRWGAEQITIARAERLDDLRLRLVPGPGVRFVGRGLPYLLKLDARLYAADGEPLGAPDTEYALRVEGQGAASLFAYPNPVRPGDTAVVFAEAAAGTRVRIFDLEGQLVRELAGGVGGGLRWDLRGGRGQRLRAGLYFYMARDASGVRTGEIVIEH